VKPDGKRILITGGGSGIGLELARRLSDTNQVVIAGRDEGKVPPAAVANAIIDGLSHDREEIRVGRVRQLARLARLAPRLADRIVTRALGSA
jgi:NAD(P)-dependent dehydrogenase (short-subunit alcohol dehydrogenase family)